MKNIIDDFNVFAIPHIMGNTSRMETGDLSDEEGLFGSHLWGKLTWLEREFLFRRSLQQLAETGEIGLEYAGTDEDDNDVYEKM